MDRGWSMYARKVAYSMRVSSEAGRRLPRWWYVRANCMKEREAELYEAQVERAREVMR